MTRRSFMTEQEAVEALARSRKRTRAALHEREAEPILTMAGIEGVQRILSMAAMHATPEEATVISVVERLLQAELEKPSTIRARSRAEFVRCLVREYYNPKGYSIRRAAEDILTQAREMNPAGQYPSEPQRSIKHIMKLNGGKIPSGGTIRKDLEKFDLL